MLQCAYCGMKATRRSLMPDRFGRKTFVCICEYRCFNRVLDQRDACQSSY